MSSDPLGLSAGINTYGYVSGNSDRLGLFPVEYHLNNWICNSSSWQEALDKAREGKMGNFDPKDPMDDDNKTAAEHYIFARNMGAGNDGPLIWSAYFVSGGYWAYGYQGIKKLGYSLSPKASRPSYMQLYWGSKGYTDSFSIFKGLKVFPGEPNKNSCGCERK